jgi:hypothetical protein
VRKEPAVFGTISSNMPGLADNAAFRARYTYNFTPMWGVQLPSRASNAGRGDGNLGFTTADIDAMLNITSGYRIVSYTFAGVRYAWTQLGIGRSKTA